MIATRSSVLTEMQQHPSARVVAHQGRTTTSTGSQPRLSRSTIAALPDILPPEASNRRAATARPSRPRADRRPA
jgi:hypothetical protein